MAMSIASDPLGDLLERCIEQDVAHRHKTFDEVLAVLEAMKPVLKVPSAGGQMVRPKQCCQE